MRITFLTICWQWRTVSADGLTKESTPDATLSCSANCEIISIGIKFKERTKEFLEKPTELLVAAWKDNKEIGSTTVVVLTLNETGGIKSSLIGDSGYMILRPKPEQTEKLSLIYRSTEQQHSFNFPFQIGSQGDHPSVAFPQSHQVQKGDILVLGTDGLFDNLFDENIISEVEGYLAKSPFSASEIAQKIALSAYKKSLDSKWPSPFALNARKAGYRTNGGKSDDITVVVARVESE